MSRIQVAYTVKPDHPKRSHALKVLRIVSRIARQMGLGVDWGETLGDPGEHSYVDVWVSVPDSVAVEFFDRVGSVPEVGVSVNCENELQKQGLIRVMSANDMVVELVPDLDESWEIAEPIPGSLPTHHPKEMRA